MKFLPPFLFQKNVYQVALVYYLFLFELWSGVQNNISIPPKLIQNVIVVFRCLELVTS